MEDRRLEVLAQYDFTVENHYNARGALLLETDRGLKLLRPCVSGEQRLEFEDAVKQYIRTNHGPDTDVVCRTTEEKLLSENTFGDKFCVRDWYPGEECSLKNPEHCMRAVDTLNALHQAMNGFPETEAWAIYKKNPLAEQFHKRARELKRVRGYIRDKKQKSEFEVLYLKLCDSYYEQALASLEYINSLEAGKGTFGLCHGSFTYHSLLIVPERDFLQDSDKQSKGRALQNGNPLFCVTSFDKTAYGMQISDFYYLLRKTMEKNDWDIPLGTAMIERYFGQRSETEADYRLLRAQLLFPEKFWKITNYYYNNRKSWIPKKNLQKMFSNHDREPVKAEFLRTLV